MNERDGAGFGEAERADRNNEEDGESGRVGGGENRRGSGAGLDGGAWICGDQDGEEDDRASPHQQELW